MSGKRLFFFFAAALAALPFVACHGDGGGGNGGGAKYDVYVAGKHSLWTNGVRQDLSPGRDLDGNSVFVSGKDVYVAGVERKYSNNAVLWKNGEVVGRMGYGEASSVCVSGGKVYVAGFEDVGQLRCPRLWVDGERQELEGDGSDGYANCVFVSQGGDVYVAGRRGGAALWKNGGRQALENGGGAYGEALSVCVSDGKTYVVGQDGSGGYYTGKATLWVDGAAQGLDILPVAVHASGGDVYIAGWKGADAVLWRNGDVQALKDGMHRTFATGLCVAGGRTFVSGYAESGDNAVPMLWVDGEAQRLAPESADIIASSVYAVERAE